MKKDVFSIMQVACARGVDKTNQRPFHAKVPTYHTNHIQLREMMQTSKGSQ